MWEWGGVVNFSWRDAVELVTFLFGDTVELATSSWGCGCGCNFSREGCW